MASARPGGAIAVAVTTVAGLDRGGCGSGRPGSGCSRCPSRRFAGGASGLQGRWRSDAVAQRRSHRICGRRDGGERQGDEGDRGGGNGRRKAVAKADVVLAQYLQSAWGTYAAAERSAATLNARERATISADSKKEVAGAELAAVKAVAPARKTSMIATAEANGVYHVKVTGIIADLGILGGEIKVEQVKASHSLISPATLKKRALR